ncbi:MAG: SufE family protein [Deltaproteobacteria bacterium]|nr:SufE family protein [Deltaproteobacteria bacterium]
MKTLTNMETYLRETAEGMNSLRKMDKLEMYRMLAEMGDNMPPLNEGEQVDKNFVRGCASNVLVAAECVDGVMVYRGSSESHVVRGYLAVLVDALSGLSPDDVVRGSHSAVEAFARDTDIKASLTPNRANAFGNIYKLMVTKAASLTAAT